MNDEMSIF